MLTVRQKKIVMEMNNFLSVASVAHHFSYCRNSEEENSYLLTGIIGSSSRNSPVHERQSKVPNNTIHLLTDVVIPF